MIALNNFQDDLCQLATDTDIVAEHIHSRTAQFSINDERSSHLSESALDNMIISLPLDKILRLNADYDPTATSLCLQVLHLGYSFKLYEGIQNVNALSTDQV